MVVIGNELIKPLSAIVCRQRLNYAMWSNDSLILFSEFVEILVAVIENLDREYGNFRFTGFLFSCIFGAGNLLFSRLSKTGKIFCDGFRLVIGWKRH